MIINRTLAATIAAGVLGSFQAAGLAQATHQDEDSKQRRLFETRPAKGSYLVDPRLDEKINQILNETEERIAVTDKRIATPSRKGRRDRAQAWWIEDAAKPLGSGTPRRVSLEDLYLRAIEHSTQIQVFSDTPVIRETAIQEAKGVFDTRGFLESAYEYTNNPVGTLLDTGYATGRFEQKRFRNEAGIRKRISTGADLSVSQEIGFMSSNSSFLSPNPQGNSKLKLSVVQPLLRGAGVAYNRAIIDIALLDTEAAYHEQVRQAESHLLEISRSYWTLYFARVSYARKKRYYNQARFIADELKAREEVDALQGQIARAESAVAFRESDFARAAMEIANAEDRLRTLVNDPDLAVMGSAEIIPSDSILTARYPVNFRSAVSRAIHQRPEILQAILQIRAAAVREKMSRNEILPQLNLFLEGYVAGIEENRNSFGAWRNQFNQGAPGALIGFSLEFPFENNTAKARLERRRLELRQQFSQLKSTIDTVLLEVKASLREVDTAWKDYSSKARAVEAANADLAQFTSRREIDTAASGEAGGPGGATATSGRTQSAYLDEWLNAQTRLDVAEQEFARVAVIYQVAIVNLERAQGNLLRYENIDIVRTTDDAGLPLLKLEKAPGGRGYSK